MLLKIPLLYCCCLFLAISAIYCDSIFSSMHKIEDSLDYFKNNLEMYRNTANKVPEPHHSNAKQAFENLQNMTGISSPLENPIGVLNFLQNVYVFRYELEKSKIKHNINLKKMTSMEDLQGVYSKILELQWTHDLPTYQISMGDFGNGLKPVAPLTADNCAILASIAQNLKLMTLTMMWRFETVYKMMQLTPRLSRVLIPIIDDRKLEEDLLIKLLQYFQMTRQYYFGKFLAETMTSLYGYHGYMVDYRGRLLNGGGLFKYCVKGWPELRKISFRPENRGTNTYDLMKRFCKKDEILHPSGYCRYAALDAFGVIAPTEEEIVSFSPRIILWHKVFTDRELNLLIKKGEPFMSRSLVVEDRNGRAVYLPSQHRISHAHFLNATGDEAFYNQLDRKISRMVGLKVDQKSEMYQINNYGIGGFYVQHKDSFNEEEMEKIPEEFEDEDTKQFSYRIATAMIYLSDVKAGGATYFPRLNVASRPRKGSLIFWYNHLPDGRVDERTLHGGCPVLSGSKWVVNKWIRSPRQMLLKNCPLNRRHGYL